MIERPVATAGLAVLFAFVLLALPAAAQNYWLRAADGNSVSLDFHKGSFDDSEGLNFFTSVIFLSGYIEASDRHSVIVELPSSHLDTDLGEQSLLLGNPYLGLEVKFPGASDASAAVWRLGLRPPVASDDELGAAVFGINTVFDRFNAFIPHLWTFSGGAGYSALFPNDLKLSLDVNAEMMWPTERGVDPELYVGYSVSFWQFHENTVLGFGFTGRMWLTERELSFGRRAAHQLGMFAGYDFGNFEPGLHFRIPVDGELSESINFTWGINLTYTFEAR